MKPAGPIEAPPDSASTATDNTVKRVCPPRRMSIVGGRIGTEVVRAAPHYRLGRRVSLQQQSWLRLPEGVVRSTSTPRAAARLSVCQTLLWRGEVKHHADS